MSELIPPIGISVDEIDACLPQTQCTRCDYPCCLDYATAISLGEATINRCPPGGDVTLEKLSTLTGQALHTLDPDVGAYQAKTLAFIIEAQCIGCVLCIKACPVDAIVGANKQMHTVIADHCTGCELCLPVCPTDCIEMRPLDKSLLGQSDWPGYTAPDITHSKQRFGRRQARLERKETETSRPQSIGNADRQAAILAAVKRKKMLENNE